MYYNISKKSLFASGQPILVLCNGIGSSNSAWKYVIEDLQSSFIILQVAYRGTIEYSSDMNLQLTRHAEDVFELVEDLNINVFGIIGWSMGVQVALHLSTMIHPKAMVLLSGAQNQATSRTL